jgi:hypothetical protein
MKKSLVLALALMLLLVSVTPSLAAGRGPTGTFSLAGTITAINGTTVTVHVVGGSPSVKAFVGKDLALQTTDGTRFLLKTDSGVVPITLADLHVGQNISANGTVVNEVWTALRISVGAELIHYP